MVTSVYRECSTPGRNRRDRDLERPQAAVLELGGKTASLVFPDAGDLSEVAERAVRDSIGVMAGQGCVVPTRLIVHADIYDEMVHLVTAAAAAYKVGNPFDPEVKVGPLLLRCSYGVRFESDLVRSQGWQDEAGSPP